MIYKRTTPYAADTPITETQWCCLYALLIYHVNNHISLCDHDQNSQQTTRARSSLRFWPMIWLFTAPITKLVPYHGNHSTRVLPPRRKALPDRKALTRVTSWLWNNLFPGFQGQIPHCWSWWNIIYCSCVTYWSLHFLHRSRKGRTVVVICTRNPNKQRFVFWNSCYTLICTKVSSTTPTEPAPVLDIHLQLFFYFLLLCCFNFRFLLEFCFSNPKHVLKNRTETFLICISNLCREYLTFF